MFCWGIETPGRRGILAVIDLGTPESFQSQADYYNGLAARKAKTKSQRGMKQYQQWAERERAAIGPARAYWSEVERITTASGIDAATAQRTATLDALHSHVDAIMRADDYRPYGPVICAGNPDAGIRSADHYRPARPQVPGRYYRCIGCDCSRHRGPQPGGRLTFQDIWQKAAYGFVHTATTHLDRCGQGRGNPALLRHLTDRKMRKNVAPYGLQLSIQGIL